MRGEAADKGETGKTRGGNGGECEREEAGEDESQMTEGNLCLFRGLTDNY